ncbi:hypothetical protein AGDE_09672 [Angomonas deanei]|nr:hypothetical protein AGDE_09672 [Angomonas deanei]|eukprot:EPY29981.1 hypothetical protein AGDE_09672 [Angomonas deanei]
MSRALVQTATAAASSILLLECFPLSVASQLRKRKEDWTVDRVKTTISGCSASVTAGGATKIFVPLSLVRRVADFKKEKQLDAPSLHMWDQLVGEGALRLCLSCAEVEEAATRFAEHKNLCFWVPGGPLVSNIEFKEKFDTFYEYTFPHAMDVLQQARGESCSVNAWMCSALTCKYEGVYVPPIRVAETSAALLKRDYGPTTVVWEQGIRGLTPRWLETCFKTALSCGVPLSHLAVALSADERHPILLHKSTEAGVASFCCSTLPCGFGAAHPLISSADVHSFVEGWNDCRGEDISEREMDHMETVKEFGALLEKEFDRCLTV